MVGSEKTRSCFKKGNYIKISLCKSLTIIPTKEERFNFSKSRFRENFDFRGFIVDLIWQIICEFRMLSNDQISETRKTFVMFHEEEAVVQRCSVKKMFLKISQNSQENICVRVSFLIKLQVNFSKFSRTLFFIEHLRWLLLTRLTQDNYFTASMKMCFVSQRKYLRQKYQT